MDGMSRFSTAAFALLLLCGCASSPQEVPDAWKRGLQDARDIAHGVREITEELVGVKANVDDLRGKPR